MLHFSRWKTLLIWLAAFAAIVIAAPNLLTEAQATERNGYTPLTQAGWRAHWDTAKLLMEAGAVCQKAELVGEPLYKECTKRQ